MHSAGLEAHASFITRQGFTTSDRMIFFTKHDWLPTRRSMYMSQSPFDRLWHTTINQRWLWDEYDII